MILAILVGMVLTFAVVVTIHELGHYAAARMVGVQPKVFSLGFGRVLASRTDRRGCTWQIAAWPLGGYCRFLGNENAASLARDREGPAPMGSLDAAPLPARAFVAVAGPAANLVLAFALFVLGAMLSASPTHPLRVTDLDARVAGGLQAGDVVRAVNGTPLGRGMLPAALDPAVLDAGDAGAVLYGIARAGEPMTAQGPHPLAPVVGHISPGSAAARGGLRPGDLLLEADGRPLRSWADLQAALALPGPEDRSGVAPGAALAGTASIPDAASGVQPGADGSAAPRGSHVREMVLRIDRAGQRDVVVVGLTEARQGRHVLGVGHRPPVTYETASPALSVAVGRSWDQMTGYVAKAGTGIAAILVGRGEMCELSGPAGIAQVSGQALTLGLPVFVQFMAVISAGLALMNLVPIPGLDGGHLASYAVEGVRGRPMGPWARKLTFVIGATAVVYLVLMATMADLLC